jgi:hypothetical protein
MASPNKKTKKNQECKKKPIDTELRKEKAQKINNANYEQYRLTLNFGKIKRSNNKIVEPMLQVSNFLHKWHTIDKHAKLAVLNGEFKTHLTTSHIYNNQDLPTNPTEIKSTLHAFYTKSRKDDLVLNTTIEILSNNSYWATIKLMSFICASVINHDITKVMGQ